MPHEHLSLAQAYENVAQAVAAYRGTLADHQLLQQSLAVIKQALQQSLQHPNHHAKPPETDGCVGCPEPELVP